MTKNFIVENMPETAQKILFMINQGHCEGNAIFNLKQLMRVLEIGVKSIRPLVDEVSACSKIR